MDALLRRPAWVLPLMLLALLVTAPAALSSGRDVLADAKDNQQVDGCYTRADLDEALRLARADQRLYGVLVDVISEAQISNVAVKGEPCGTARRVPGRAVDDTGGGSPAVWGGAVLAIGVVGTGAGLMARRRRGG
ncbi:MAG TPA: hypothetical protein VL422_11785 [Miltoncostaea sp.]|nr:hypothetical protein [Miltoncostaea sp.]